MGATRKLQYLTTAREWVTWLVETGVLDQSALDKVNAAILAEGE